MHEHRYKLSFTGKINGEIKEWHYMCVEDNCEDNWFISDKPLHIENNESLPGEYSRRNAVATYNIVAGKKIPRNR